MASTRRREDVEQQRPTRHFLLLRHCVRSTHETMTHINPVHDGDSDNTAHHPSWYSIRPEDYLSPTTKWPDWQIPPLWCTPDGLTQVEHVGEWILRHILSRSSSSSRSPPRRIRVEIISDVVDRDVQTAFHLAQGMKNLATTSNSTTEELPPFRLDGIDQLYYDDWIFDPIDSTTPWDRDGKPLCHTTFSQKEQWQSVQHRLATIPPPSSVHEILQFLTNEGGKGIVGNLTTYFANHNHNHSLMRLDPETNQFVGAVVWIKALAQMVFYSRAGNISQPYLLPHLSSAEVYQLLSWVHWSRSVTEVGTPSAATYGAVLAQVMLKVLDQGRIHALSQDYTKEDYDDTLTIVVGHDGNLDDLATALGSTGWIAPAPYESHASYYPTPPVSGLYIRRDAGRDAAVHLSFVTPVYSSATDPANTSESWVWNDTGILEQVPLLFSPDTSRGVGDTTTSHDSVMENLEQLKGQIHTALDGYMGALDCFVATETHLDYIAARETVRVKGPVVLGWRSHTVVAATAGVFGFVVLMVILWRYCSCTNRRHRIQKSIQYSGAETADPTNEGEDYEYSAPVEGDLELT